LSLLQDFDGLLHAISLDNELGQIITIIFEQLVVNPAITPKTFELNIDSSFDVIKNSLLKFGINLP
jgi:outer membrane lipoprotein-sorting protein